MTKFEKLFYGVLISICFLISFIALYIKSQESTKIRILEEKLNQLEQRVNIINYYIENKQDTIVINLLN